MLSRSVVDFPLGEATGESAVWRLGQPLEELLDGDGHGEAGGSDADTRPATITDHGNAGFSHALDEIACEVTVARVPDPLTVCLIESCPPLMGKLQGVTHRGTTFWVVAVEVADSIGMSFAGACRTGTRPLEDGCPSGEAPACRAASTGHTSKAGFIERRCPRAESAGVSVWSTGGVLPAVLPAEGLVVEGGSGIDQLLGEFTLSGDKLVDDLTLSHEQLLEGIVCKREHRGAGG
jgi:hypothetical protein